MIEEYVIYFMGNRFNGRVYRTIGGAKGVITRMVNGYGNSIDYKTKENFAIYKLVISEVDSDNFYYDKKRYYVNCL